MRPNNTLSRLDKSSLSNRVYESLLTAIVRQEFSAGQNLDIETLAQTFGVSRSPIQAAIARLADLGLVEIKARRGTCISKLSTEDVHELFEIRALIEGHAVKKAAISATKAELRAIRELISEMEKLFNGDEFKDYYDFLDLDRQFHSMIVRLGRNKRLVAIYDQARTLIELTRASASRHAEGANLTRKRHIAISDGLMERDVNKAAKAIENHLKESEKGVLERLHMTGHE